MPFFKALHLICRGLVPQTQKTEVDVVLGKKQNKTWPSPSLKYLWHMVDTALIDLAQVQCARFII